MYRLAFWQTVFRAAHVDTTAGWWPFFALLACFRLRLSIRLRLASAAARAARGAGRRAAGLPVVAQRAVGGAGGSGVPEQGARLGGGEEVQPGVPGRQAHAHRAAHPAPARRPRGGGSLLRHPVRPAVLCTSHAHACDESSYACDLPFFSKRIPGLPRVFCE